MALNASIDVWLRRELAAKPLLDNEDLRRILVHLARWRHQLISNTLLMQSGDLVANGPFAGMRYAEAPTEGCRAPRLLGCYEHELHEEIEALVREPFAAVLNVGCAEGYYAVGLARRMPQVQVFAHDIDGLARAACSRLSAMNGVAGQVQVGARFRGEDFAAFADRRTLLVLDIEGGERDLLDPEAWPALRGMTVVVECHDCFDPGLSERLALRFAASHSVRRIEHQWPVVELPGWMDSWSHLDRLLGVWEWRSGPTPWLVMRPL